jgi:hypothetical protein
MSWVNPCSTRVALHASEWGQIYLYTHDGFYVDAMMNNPASALPSGPYTFGGETSGGRIQYFPKRDERCAYSNGMAYRVQGFRKGAVDGELRIKSVWERSGKHSVPRAEQRFSTRFWTNLPNFTVMF